MSTAVVGHRFVQEWSAESPYCGALVLDADGCGETCGKRRDDPVHALTPSGYDEFSARLVVRQIIDSYALCMVPPDAAPYIDACADDVIQALLGWPVTYDTDSDAR